MKATLDLPEDIYQAAKSLADRKKISLGAAVTELARRGRALLIGGKRSPWREDDPTLPAELDGIADDQDPEAQAVSREQLRLLLDRLTEELSPLGRRLFQLLFLEELPIEAAARQTGLSPEAVYAWRSRIKQLSHRLLAEMSLVELPKSRKKSAQTREGTGTRQSSPQSSPPDRSRRDAQIASLNDQIWELIVAHGNDPGLPALVAPLREQLRALQREEAEVVRPNFQAQLQFDAEAGMRFIEETERLWKGR